MATGRDDWPHVSERLDESPAPPATVSEGFLRDVIEAVNDALFIHEAKTGKLLFVNARMREMYGYTLDEALALDVGVLSSGVRPYSNDDAARWMQKSRTERPQTFEWLARHRDGHTFWVEVNLRFAVLDGTESFVATVRDVDKRKNAENALERKMIALTRPLDDSAGQLDFTDLFNIEDVQRLQDAFAAATGVASIITYPDGTPITKPSNFCYLCEHIIRKTEKGLRNCYHSDAVLGRAHRGGALMQPCLSGGLWDGGTSVYVGNRHVANWLIGQVFDDSIDRQRLLAYAREIGANENEFSRALDDVTRMPQEQFRKVCEALHVFAHQLSTLAYRNVQQARDIAERRRAAEERSRLEEQLRQSQKMESIGRLAGGIAHDFNNLLVPILGYTEMLLDESSTDDFRRQELQEILDAALRSRDLVQQLLAFGRKQLLRLQVVDLREVLSRFTGLLRRAIRENIKLTVRLCHDEALILADRGQLEQIIMNLAVNAQDAMPEGGELEITLLPGTADPMAPEREPDGAERQCIHLIVRDTGFGMDATTREHLFEPFFTTKAVGRGTGLGLSTVYGIVEQHGGHIAVESTPGQGTTFDVSFTVAKKPRDVESVLETDLPVAAAPADTHLIVMEDDPRVRALLVSVLTKHGFRVTAPSNAAECCELVERKSATFDALVTDVIMPDIDGRSLYERLRIHLPDLPVLLLSGYDGDLITRHGVLDEGVQFLQKPFTSAALVGKMQAVLGRQTP